MSKLEEIADGLKNTVKSKLDLTTDSEELVFEKRKKICDSCEHNKDGLYCKVCGCLLSLKVKSIKTTCPKGLW